MKHFSLDPRLWGGPVSLPYNSTPLPLTPILLSGEWQHRDAALAYSSTRRHAAEDHNPVLNAVLGVLVCYGSFKYNFIDCLENTLIVKLLCTKHKIWIKL